MFLLFGLGNGPQELLLNSPLLTGNLIWPLPLVDCFQHFGWCCSHGNHDFIHEFGWLPLYLSTWPHEPFPRPWLATLLECSLTSGTRRSSTSDMSKSNIRSWQDCRKATNTSGTDLNSLGSDKYWDDCYGWCVAVPLSLLDEEFSAAVVVFQ
jgi:hypothetical protein